MITDMVIFWLVAMVALIVIELATLGLTTIWFACGALAAVIAAALDAPLLLQILMFVVVSFAVLLAVRPIAVKYFNKDRTRTNIESMIGRQAIVVSEIDNMQGVGQVSVNGMDWSARSTINELKISVGRVVVIRAVDGVKLIVEENKTNKAN
ncbi:MAG: NfeD family protein [Butyrivibrio sp.]|nr:NfeD family protein [Butyrivibrio sp.]